MQITCFGFGEEYKPQHVFMYEQVAILDYRGPNDFVIELKTKSERDRLILAKTQPLATLAATVETVQSRAAKVEPIKPRRGDVLKVPRFNFDITRRFEELEQRRLVSTREQADDRRTLVSAVQNIRFELDEWGVRLRSESHIAFGCGAEAGPPKPHIMLFDKPFLVLLQTSEARTPYFPLWVANDELLVPAK